MACEYEKKYKELKKAYDKLEKDKIWNDVVPKSKIKGIISELELKDKMIDEMAKGIAKVEDQQVCEYCCNCMPYCENDKYCEINIKRYFERKIRDAKN